MKLISFVLLLQTVVQASLFHPQQDEGIDIVEQYQQAYKKFTQNLIYTADQLKLGDEYRTLGDGVCEALFINTYDYFTFVSWDNFNRDKVKDQAAIIDVNNGDLFYYKTCQLLWQIDSQYKDISSCAHEGEAYLVDNATQKCKYSYSHPQVKELFVEENDDQIQKGVVLNFTSKEDCGGQGKKYEYLIQLMCDKDQKTAQLSSTSSKDSCHTETVYQSQWGCFKYQLPIGKVAQAIGPFVGAILIVFGLVMTFAGAKFLFIVISLCLGIISTGLIFFLSYALFIDPTSDNAKTITIVLLVVAIVVSIIITVLGYKFTQSQAGPLVAGSAGALGGYMIYNVSDIGNKMDEGSIWIQAVFIVIGGAIGLALGKKLHFTVKTVGTAFIGSVITALGVSFYCGKLVPVKGEPYSAFVWAYVGGIVVFWAIGSVVQWKYFNQSNEDDGPEDLFEGEKEGGKLCQIF